MKIGIAGVRGLNMMTGFKSIPGVTVEAFCDINEDLLDVEAKKHGIKKKYRVFEDMLESDIDAVLISTPMQCHVPQTLLALEAGKHVLSEVAAGVTMDELWWLCEAADKYGKVYMMAENYCYIPTNQLIKKLVGESAFGEVYFAEGEYIHEAKNLTVYPDGKHSWRNYWHFNKRGMFYPTHSIGPIMQWFEGDRIKTVTTLGTDHFTAPEFKQEDTSITLIRTEKGRLIKLRLDCISYRPHNMSYYSLQGTNGAYEAPRGLGDDHKVWFREMDPDTDHAKWRPLKDFSDRMPERYINATEEQKAAGHWGGDYFIVKDFVDAAKDGIKPAIDVFDACEWTAVAFLSELSVSNNGKTMEMPDFRKFRNKKDQIIKI